MILIFQISVNLDIGEYIFLLPPTEPPDGFPHIKQGIFTLADILKFKYSLSSYNKLFNYSLNSLFNTLIAIYLDRIYRNRNLVPRQICQPSKSPQNHLRTRLPKNY